MNDDDNKKEDTNGDEKKTWKTRSTLDLDLEKLIGMTFKDRVYHLAMSGWRIEVETRSGNEYLYAIKYFERKKRRFYLGKKADLPDL